MGKIQTALNLYRTVVLFQSAKPFHIVEFGKHALKNFAKNKGK